MTATRETAEKFHGFIVASVSRSVGLRVATELLKNEANTEQFEASVKRVNEIISEEADKFKIIER
jgi:hypothetical protein